MAACVATAISPPSSTIGSTFEDFLDATRAHTRLSPTTMPVEDDVMVHANAVRDDGNLAFLSPHVVAALTFANHHPVAAGEAHAKAFQTCRFGYRGMPPVEIATLLPPDAKASDVEEGSEVGNSENCVHEAEFEQDATASETNIQISEIESESVPSEDVNVTAINDETLTEEVEGSEESVIQIEETIAEGTFDSSEVSGEAVVLEEDSVEVSVIAEKQVASMVMIGTDKSAESVQEDVSRISLVDEITSKCDQAEVVEESDSAAFLAIPDATAHAVQGKSELAKDYEGIIVTECMTAVEVTVALDSGVPDKANEEVDIAYEGEPIIMTLETSEAAQLDHTENVSRVATEEEDQTVSKVHPFKEDVVTGSLPHESTVDKYVAVEPQQKAEVAVSTTRIVHEETASNEIKPFSFTGLNHVAFCVESLERSLDFYCGLLGLETNLDRPDLPYRGAWLYLGAEGIHIMEVPNPDPVKGRPSHGGFDRHACLNCSNVEGIRLTFEKAGIPYQPSMVPSLFARDPDGNGLEFIEVNA